MSLWKSRNEYTKSKYWPVVPFRLTEYDEKDENLKQEYRIGLDKNLVRGWAVNLSESLEPDSHPILVWEKKSVALQRDVGGCKEYEPIETELYYHLLSPICHFFREKDDFRACCREQDKNVIDKVFQIMDQLASKEIKNLESQYTIVNSGGHCGSKELLLRKIDIDDCGFYFEYNCPCLNMTEMIFPIICEGITIALIITGQIVEDEDLVKDAINHMDITEDEKQEICKKVKCDKKEKILALIFSHIKTLQNSYIQQINGERRRILDDALKEVTKKLFSNPVSNKQSISMSTMSQRITQSVELIRDAKTFLIDRTGIDDILLFLDPTTLKADSFINRKGKFYKDILEQIDESDSKWEKWYETYEETGDLFNEELAFVDIESSLGDGQVRTYLFKGEAKAKWSFYVLIPGQNDEPIIFGVKYKGKKRFLRKEQMRELLFEEYLLPNIALIIQNIQLRIQSQHQALVLTENRERLSHEIGQIAIGIRGLDYYYDNKIKEYKHYLSKGIANKNFDIIKHAHDSFLSKVEFYRGDVAGQFEIAEMLVKIHGDDYVPNPRPFDLWKEFMNRWNFIFMDACTAENKYLSIPFGKDVEPELREVSTDPILLQCVLYNVVNNAIKYSLVNTRISVGLVKTTKPEEYIFTVKNYGAYLDPNDQSIYKKGVRNSEMKGLVSKQKDYIVPGEGVGLYWSKMLAKKLDGGITHSCSKKDEPICKYNVPLMKPLFEKYHNYAIFRELWDKKKALGIINSSIPEPSYEDIKKEYERLIQASEGTSIYDRIVTPWEDKELKNIEFTQISTDIIVPTYEVTFTIKIPRMEKRK